MAAFNWFDWVIVIIFGLSVFAGLARGFVKEVIALITMAAAFVIATLFTNTVAQYITSTEAVQNAIRQAGSNTAVSISYVTYGASFALIFIIVWIIGAIIGFFLNSLFTGGVLGFGNRLLGAIFGFFRAFILTLTLIFILQLTAASKQSWWHNSVLIKYYQPVLGSLATIVSPHLADLKEKFGDTLQDINKNTQQ